jgi:hypothetical protein
MISAPSVLSPVYTVQVLTHMYVIRGETLILPMGENKEYTRSRSHLCRKLAIYLHTGFPFCRVKFLLKLNYHKKLNHDKDYQWA